MSRIVRAPVVGSAVSGFVGNGDLLPLEGGAFVVVELHDAVCVVCCPALDVRAGGQRPVHRVSAYADIHRLRTAWMEVAPAGWLDQVGRGAGDVVQARGGQRDGRAEQLSGVRMLRTGEDL